MSKTGKSRAGSIFTFLILIIATIGLNVLIAYFLTDTNLPFSAGWLRGFWHGGNIIGNFVLSLFMDGRLLQTPIHTTAYTVFWWIGAVTVLLSFIQILFKKK